MPPASSNLVSKDRFAHLFGGLRTQSYPDPNARGPGSHSIRTLAWNPTGTLIATGSVDRTLRIWNPERPDVRYSTELRGHSSGIEQIAFNPVKESELASCSKDGTVRFWDVRAKNCVGRVDVGGEAFSLAWSPDGSILLAGRMDDTLVPIAVEPVTISTDPPPNTPKAPSTYRALPHHKQPVRTNGIAFSHSFDASLFLTTGDGAVKIESYPSFTSLHTLNAHTAACLCVSLAPTARYLAVGGGDSLISLWDTTNWVCQRTVSSSGGGAVRGISWSWDGRFIVGACDEADCGGTGLEIFHAETGDSVYTIPTGNSNVGVPAVAWHPSRYCLAYSLYAEGIGSGNNGLRIVGAGAGDF
ncbi:THO complex subunit 3 [Nannizzia gypsea CBS 118893]|uniref:THO complex subunit 3 n=1 Tax=Arthroderma gypseum (strain ATCC MYA-4604 / CBS 118893) TaxID=535722 RepID=E4V0Y8_ARTGP|nr:THO complex subunit 3 [Nannizzia gypsea CBS 118893]EFR03703.1 THO complex subunit 3 [Nannizzia gypsea CBS 118893]